MFEKGNKLYLFKCCKANCKPARSDKVHRVEPTLYSLVCFQQAGTTQSVPSVFTLWLYHSQCVLTLWPSCPLCTDFSGSSHPQMHLETLIISLQPAHFALFFLLSVINLLLLFLLKCFVCLCSEKRDTWRGTLTCVQVADA